MAQVTDTVLKGYFETGDTPTEAQYIDLIDSLRNALDTIAQADVDGLPAQTATISGSGSIVVPAAKLMLAIVLIPSAGGTYKIGTTPGGSEYETGSLTGTTPYTYANIEYSTPSITLYFTGTFEAEVHTR